MCQNLQTDLFGNVIATHTKAAKIVSVPTVPDTPTDTPPKTPIAVETLGITPNYISTYDTFLDGPNQNSVATAELNFQDRHHDCKMSAAAIKTIKKCTQLICYLSRKEYFAQEKAAIRSGCTTKRYAEIEKEAVKRVVGYYDEDGNKIAGKHLCTFVTLTLPSEQRHTDRQLCSQLLNPFLVWARKQKKVKYYVWKKELQSNGNLHFHIIWDRTVPWQDIRAEWNKLCNKGKIKGIKQPFDYVTRYHDKWANIHKDGFNREYVREYVSNLPSTEELVKERWNAWETETHTEMTSAEYNQLRHDVIEGIVAKYYKSYQNEIYRALHDEKPYTIFSDPNSTDIKAVNSPQQVAGYLSKYIAKDIENNPALTDYQDNVEHMKKDMKEWQKAVTDLQTAGKDSSVQYECWQKSKRDLDQYRKKNCPVKGRMWFKSKSLTVFLSGVKAEVDNDYFAELADLETYLHSEEKRINADRAEKAKKAEKHGDHEKAAKLKEPISLVLERYDTTLSYELLADKITQAITYAIANADPLSAVPNDVISSLEIKEVLMQYGTKINRLQLAEYVAAAAAKGDKEKIETLIQPILSVIIDNSKCICKTMVITMFDLQHLQTETGRTRFPYLSHTWNRFIKDCLDYNTTNNLL